MARCAQPAGPATCARGGSRPGDPALHKRRIEKQQRCLAIAIGCRHLPRRAFTTPQRSRWCATAQRCGHRKRKEPVFHAQNTGGKAVLVIACLHRNNRLTDDRTCVKVGCHPVHCGAMH